MTDPTCSATRQKYDVIICGTDLCQSILSSALSRAGKKVLHCDGNDWYGGFDAVLYGGSTLDCFIESCLDNQQREEEEGAAKKTEYEISNRVESDEGIDSLRLLPKEKYASLKLHSQTVIVQENDNIIAATDDVATSDDIDQPTIENLSLQNDATNTKNISQISDDNNTTAIEASNDQLDGFSLDISPCLLYASGDAVEGLVKSGVSDYLEFKSVEGLFVLMAEDDSSTSSARRGNRNRNKSGGTNGSSGDDKVNEKPLMISYRVPMSKSDVFRSKLLSPVDKRRLMKFLQLITDYGMAMTSQIDEEAGEQLSLPEDSNNIEVEKSIDITSNMGEDVIQSVNERRLHRGRALSRPQNKATPSSSDMESLLRCVRDGVSFSDFLKTVVKLPERLAIVVVYALALSPFGYCNDTIEPKTDAMTRVSKYSTKEGVEDLLLHVTALGRFGHTAFLTAMYGSGELSQSFCRSGAVYGSTYMLRRSPLRITFETGSQVRGVVLGGEGHIGGFGDVDTTDASDEEILCEHVIVPSTMIDPSLLQNASQSRIYRRISILRGKLVAAQEDQSDTDNASKTEQRYAIIIPPGTRGLSNQSAIHAVVVDDSVCVSPRGKQYTVLHLTMSSFPGDCYSDEVCDETLGQAVQYLIRSQTSNEGTSVVECHHVTFSFTSDSPNKSEENQNPGLHIAYRDLQSITCDSAFREAKRIFDKICPDADFLALAKKVEDEIVYRNEEDSDDERVVLDSAVTMIEAPLQTGKKTSEETATLSCGETSDEEAKPEIEKTSEAGLEAAIRPR